MKVICKYNKAENITDKKRRQFLQERGVLIREEIQINKEYLVYSVQCFDNKVFHCILEEEVDDLSPRPYEADFFEIIDPRLSSYWKFNFYHYLDETVKAVLAYPEWLENPVHFENLVDGDPEAQAIFNKYKILMDKEFSDN